MIFWRIWVVNKVWFGFYILVVLILVKIILNEKKLNGMLNLVLWFDVGIYGVYRKIFYSKDLKCLVIGNCKWLVLFKFFCYNYLEYVFYKNRFFICLKLLMMILFFFEFIVILNNVFIFLNFLEFDCILIWV